jgi:hypothetical protein
MTFNKIKPIHFCWKLTAEEIESAFKRKHSDKSLHEILEFAEFALFILGGVGRVSWLLWHDRRKSCYVVRQKSI